MAFFSLYGDCINSKELLFYKAIAFKGNMIVKVFGRLVLVEPESRAHEGFFRDTTITIGKLAKFVGFLLTRDLGLDQDEISHHSAPVNQARWLRVQVADKSHKIVLAHTFPVRWKCRIKSLEG